MSFVGHVQDYYARCLFVIFAVIAGITLIAQLLFLRKLRILSVYLAPLISFCLLYENVLLSLSDNIGPHSAAADAGKVFHSLIAPLLVLVLFEVPCRLHEARSVQFCYIPFDQEKTVSRWPAAIFMGFMRLVAGGLFVINLVVNFSSLCEKQTRDRSQHEQDACNLVGRGGFPLLETYPRNTMLWLSLMVPAFLSAVALLMYHTLHRYGKNATLSLTGPGEWHLLGFCACCQLAGLCFATNVFSVTSNAGELALLLGVCWMVHLVQKDLSVTRKFADFLSRSNEAFRVSSASLGSEHEVESNDGDGARVSASMTARAAENPGVDGNAGVAIGAGASAMAATGGASSMDDGNEDDVEAAHPSISASLSALPPTGTSQSSLSGRIRSLLLPRKDKMSAGERELKLVSPASGLSMVADLCELEIFAAEETASDAEQYIHCTNPYKVPETVAAAADQGVAYSTVL